MAGAHHGTRPLVAVVGAGPAGTLTALHLLRQCSQQVQGLTVVLLDPVEHWGRGVAFGTTDEQHLLNVPASRMSAFPDRPGDFVAWHAERHGPTTPYTFLPRGRFGDYLVERVAGLAATAAEAGASLEHRRRRAVGIARGDGAGLSVALDDGSRLHADAVVLATGLPPAGDGWAPGALAASARFVADPWRPGALDELCRGPVDPSYDEVLLVGTGLTMVDVALTLGAAGRRLQAVSRSGRLPATHAARPVTPVLPDIDDWGGSLNAIRAHARAHVAAVTRAYGDWRPAVEGLRHRVAELWRRLDELDRMRFIAEDAGRWNAVRHKLPLASAVALDRLAAEGRLRIGAAEVVDCGDAGHGLDVLLSDGRRLRVDRVVNCTGPHQDVRTDPDPLVVDLLRERPGGALAVPATAGLGLRTRDGRVVDATGDCPAPLWALGALRRGDLWESTSVPEIRVQASDVARGVLSALGSERPTAAEIWRSEV